MWTYVLLWFALVFPLSNYGQGKWEQVSVFTGDVNRVPNQIFFLNEQYGLIGGLDEVARTTDGGKTWTWIPISLPGSAAHIYFVTPAHLYMVAANDVFESLDSGSSWKQLTTPSSKVYAHSIYYLDSILYLGSGKYSSDNGISWHSIHPQYGGGGTVIGNRDSGIAMFDQLEIDEFGTLHTTDRGSTWNIGEKKNSGFDGYAIPYKFTYFRASEDVWNGDPGDPRSSRNDSCVIFRTKDGGRTWQKIYPPAPPLYLTGSIKGAGCILYAQTRFPKAPANMEVNGVIRSKDLGETWENIGGPSNFRRSRISVVTNGAICYAVDGSNSASDTVTLWKYTDSTLLYRSKERLLVGSYSPNRSGDTIYVKMCDSTSLRLDYRYAGCGFVKMDSLQVEGLPQTDYEAWWRHDRVIRENRFDTAGITFTPTSPGTYNVKIRTWIVNEDWLSEDTTSSFVLIVKPNPGQLVRDGADTIIFSPQVLCTAAEDTASFRLYQEGCENVRFDSIRFEGVSGNTKDFLFTPKEEVTLGAPVDVPVRYKPTVAGVSTGHIIIYTPLGNDTVWVKGSGVADGRILSFISDTLSASVCDSTEGWITIHNRSCRSLTIDAIALPGELTLLSGQLPLPIASNRVEKLRVYYRPSSEGENTYLATASIRFHAPGSDESFDTTLSITVRGVDGNGELLFNPPSFNFDSLSICSSDSLKGFITNVGCDSLLLNPAEFIADIDFRLNLPAASAYIAPFDTVWYTIDLTPTQEGIRSGSIVLTSDAGAGIRRDTISITATVTHGSKILSISQNAIDFGTTTLCEERDSVITLENKGCDTLIISSADVQGLGFEISGLPLIIPPDESREITVETAIDTAGGVLANLDTITFVTNADNTISQVVLMRKFSYPPRYDVSLRVRETEGTAGDFVTLQCVAGNWSQADNVMHGVKKLDFTLSTNTDLLHYIRSQGANTVTVTGSQVAIENNADIIAPNGILAEFIYQVYLTRDSMADITISDLLINNGDPSACKPTIQSSGSGFSYRYTCGDRAIQGFLRAGKVLDIVSIHPNPAQDELTVKIRSVTRENISISIIDLTGRALLHMTPVLPPATNDLTLNTGGIPSGTYILTIETSQGLTSQRITIER